jgi:hypothetical protein
VTQPVTAQLWPNGCGLGGPSPCGDKPCLPHIPDATVTPSSCRATTLDITTLRLLQSSGLWTSTGPMRKMNGSTTEREKGAKFVLLSVTETRHDVQGASVGASQGDQSHQQRDQGVVQCTESLWQHSRGTLMSARSWCPTLSGFLSLIRQRKATTLCLNATPASTHLGAAPCTTTRCRHPPTQQAMAAAANLATAVCRAVGTCGTLAMLTLWIGWLTST